MFATLAPIFGLAFVLGLRHATDPDHVVAVAAIVARHRSGWDAGWVGVLWGLGHTGVILLVGAAIILTGLVVPARVGLAFEFGVAAMLVVLGVANVFARSTGHAGAAPRGRMPPLVVGAVHGLAGSAGATLLVLAIIPEPWWAVAALGLFGAGTIAGMTVMTAAIAAPAAYATRRAVDLGRHVRVASGVLSIGVGLYLAHRIGYVDGLFTATPRWTPG